MIIIYEDDDLGAGAHLRPLRSLLLSDIRTDRRQLIAEARADTIFIERGNIAIMVQQRNGPLNPYPVQIDQRIVKGI